MNFKRYPEMINHYNTKDIDRFISWFPELEDEKFILSEKLDGCLSFEDEIETLEYGNLKIGEIVEKKINCHVKSFDFDTNEIVFISIKNYFINDNNQDWFIIELENGIKIKLTENHRVYLPNLKVWRCVKDLIDKDFVMID